jgi:C-terminal processing protease CtpA/Prc
MLQNRRKIAQKVKQLITKNGIPVYLDKWNAELLVGKPFDNPRYTDKQFYADLTHYVKQYHYHSSLNYKLVEDESNSGTPAKQHTTIQNHKRLPEMTWDNTNKIGTIKYYEYYLDLDDQFANDPVFLQLTTTVQTKLLEWQHQGLQGLIIDLREHTGGWYFPFVKSLNTILRETALFGWSQSRVLPGTRDWITYTKGRISKQTLSRDNINLIVPIAVIIGQKTYSSGEFCAAIFYRNSGQIKVFGQETGGGLSVNNIYKITSDIQLNIPVALPTTVDGTFHEKQNLVPHVKTEQPITMAKKWLKSLVVGNSK